MKNEPDKYGFYKEYVDVLPRVGTQCVRCAKGYIEDNTFTYQGEKVVSVKCPSCKTKYFKSKFPQNKIETQLPGESEPTEDWIIPEMTAKELKKELEAINKRLDGMGNFLQENLLDKKEAVKDFPKVD